ncbi:hypothetical protein LPJ73_002007 [Coemansia sp. RSA 2703]|nr:hypothetical protein LPJ73_002007 [Coemansia sp. RSA 2703]
MMAISLESIGLSVSSQPTAPSSTANTSFTTTVDSSPSPISGERDENNTHKTDWDMFWVSENAEKHPSGPSVALCELLEDHRWLLPKGRCLVAGCGNGHDAVYLARRGVNCVGIDFCEAAIEKAQKLLEQEGAASLGKLTFAVHDFLSFRPLLRFTLAYEHGLFSAIHPSQRQRWAETYARIIMPQGTLIVLLYPLIHRGGSPPYSVTMEECEHYLKRFFVLVRVDPNCRCIEGQEGNEIMSVWKRL